MHLFIPIIFLLSGFAALTYQLVWFKELSLIFGVSYQAIAIVTSAFMSGLALGSHLFGSYADRMSLKPLNLYAFLEAGIGGGAVIIPLLFNLVNRFNIVLVQQGSLPVLLTDIIRFVLCFLVMMIPTTLMGGTLPVMSKFYIKRVDDLGKKIALLYGINTMGGVLGAAGTGFLFIRYLGAQRTVMIAVLLNLAIAGAVYFFGRIYKHAHDATNNPSAEDNRAVSATEARPKKIQIPKNKSRFNQHIFISVFVTGAAALALEILWTRILVYFVSISIYSFTVILVTFLLGITLGSLLFSRYIDRLKNPLLIFGYLQLAIGFFVLYLLQTIGNVLSETSMDLGGQFLKTGILILIPTLLMGAAFPTIIKSFTQNLKNLGNRLGKLYAVNTIGTVVGSLGASFVLLPLLGAQKSILLIAVVYTAIGIFNLVFALSAKRPLILIGLIVITVVGTGTLLVQRIKPVVLYSSSFRHGEMNQLEYYHEGTEASLAVLKGNLNLRGLNINGATTAYTSYYDVTVHKLLGHLPLLLADEPRNALIIGFGLGSTAWSMAQHEVDRIDCVELVPEERETARYFEIENGDIFEDPRFNFIVGDGRNYLLTTTQPYDVISINAIHPAMSPYLYTYDFYQVCRSKMNPDGIICVWIPLNSSYVNILLKTFQSVFPHASLWDCTTQHILLIGSIQPLSIDYYQWCKNISREKITVSLAEVLLQDPVRLLSQMILDENGIRTISVNAGINTDDWPIVQFETNPKDENSTPNRQSLMALRGTILPYLKDNLRTEDLSPLSEKLEKYHKAAPYADVGFNFKMAKNMEEAIKRMAAAIHYFPDDERLLFHLGLSWAQVLGMRANSPLQQPGLESNQRQKLISIFEAALIETKVLDNGKKYGLSETFLAEIRVYLAFLYFYENRGSEALHQVEKIVRVDPGFKPMQQLAEEISNIQTFQQLK